MPLTFEHPVGAQADTKELEYVVALLQSGPQLRSDGTIQADDVALYLRSRHGIAVTTDYIERHLFPELGGSIHGPTTFIDLCQIVSIIIIPYFLERHRQTDGSTTNRNTSVFYHILEGILADAGVPASNKKGWTDGAVESPKLTRELLLDILETYGEMVIPDVVVDEMLAVAGGEGIALDGDCFLAAMVSDVQRYNLSWQESWTSHYADVCGERRRGDFWCRSATAKVGKTVLSSTEKVGRTVLQPLGKGIVTDVIMSGEKVEKCDQDIAETSLNVVSDSNDAEGNIRSLDEQEMAEKPFKPSIRNSENDPAHGDEDDDERFVEIYTAPAIDYTAETYQSQSFFVAIWVALVSTYFVYVYRDTPNSTRLTCERWDTAENSQDIAVSYFCLLANAIINWIVIFFRLSIFGSAFIFLGSFGAATGSTIWGLVIGMATIGTCTVFAYFYSFDSPFMSTEKGPGWDAAYIISLLMGSVVLALQFLLLLRIILPKTIVPWFRNLTVFLTNGMVRKESRTKMAAVFKIDRLIDNAMELHQGRALGEEGEVKSKTEASSSTSVLGATGRALLNYQTQESKREISGGIWWAWKRMINRSIVAEEGIWLHGRLVASNFFQAIVAVAVFFVLNEALRSSYADPSEGVDDDAILELIPQSWEMKLSFAVGTLAGFVAAISVAVMYIPSFISTTLKFRYGVLPSLGNSTFQQYRVAVDLVAMLFGSMFWGCIVTVGLCFLFFGLITFLFAYQITREAAVWVTAQMIGFALTLCIKVIVLRLLRNRLNGGFYRRRVVASNFVGLVLECWYLGLSSGYMIARSFILIFVSATYVGRIDTPVLADGVGNIGPIVLDSYPISFRKDILLHEAHRHPYIERLGAMYLMKVRYGDDFSTRAGAMWRVLFVLAMFPWLRKYRFPPSPKVPDELDFCALAMEEGDGASMSGQSNLDSDGVGDNYFDCLERNAGGEQGDNGTDDVAATLPVVSRQSFQEEVQQQQQPTNNDSSSLGDVEASQEVITPKKVSFLSTPLRVSGRTSGGTIRRRKSLADMNIKSSNSQREVLLRFENESLKQQNRWLLEELQILRQQASQQQQQQQQRAGSRSSFQSILHHLPDRQGA